MNSIWPIKTIAECASSEPYSTQIGPFGKALMAHDYTPAAGVPVLRGVNVNHGRFHDDDFVFVDEKTADRLWKFESYPGDVLLVHKGTLGEIGLMPERRKYPRYIMGNSMMRVRCNLAVLLPQYLYYWLTSANGQHYLFSRVSQVGVPQIQTPLTTLRQAALPVPPLVEQQAIVAILGALDDKIELNRRMNETLEAIAQAIFKSWFIDFDPVRARAEGREPYGMDAETAALFPNSFRSDSRELVPSGWLTAPFSSLVEVLSGGTPKTAVSGYWGGEVPWVSVADTVPGPYILTTAKMVTRLGIDESAASILPVETLVITARGTVGNCALVAEPMAMNQSCYGLRGKSGVGQLFLLQLARELVARLRASAHGSVFDTITRSTFDSVSVVVPPAHCLQRFEAAVRPFFDRILSNQRESLTLAALRDTLLPKLLSGEVRVPQSEPVLAVGS